MGQDINEYIAIYNETAKDYQVGENQKLQYFHNLFDSTVKCFGVQFKTASKLMYRPLPK